MRRAAAASAIQKRKARGKDNSAKNETVINAAIIGKSNDATIIEKDNVATRIEKSNNAARIEMSKEDARKEKTNDEATNEKTSNEATKKKTNNEDNDSDTANAEEEEEEDCDTRQEGKAPRLWSALKQQSNSSLRSSYGQSVIVVQNSSDMHMEDFEPSLLKCVKQVLTDTEGQHSFMIVNRDKECEEASQEQTTYIIDLDSRGKQTDNLKTDTIEFGKKTDLSASSSEVTSASRTRPGLPLGNTSMAASAQQSSPTKDLAQVTSSPADLDFQEQVEISFVSCPSEMDLNNPTSEADISIEISCSQVDSPPVTQLSQTSDTNEPMKVTGKASAAKNLTGHSLPTVSSIPPSAPTINVRSARSLLPSSLKPGTSTNLESQQKESHISAEHLLHMAKKRIDITQSTKNISGQQTGQAVTEDMGSSESSNSEPVITMYLSSSDDLKEIIHKLHVKSSTVATPHLNEPPLDDKEAKENSPVSHNSCQDIQILRPTKTNSVDSSNLSDSLTDSIASMLPSITAGGVLYRCAECGYCSHNKHYYKQHVDLVHNEDRPYKCPHCDYAGKRRHALLEHLVVHSNMRPFTCDHCNASFRKKGHLTNHIKLHTSQRLMHCGVCNIQLPDTLAFELHLSKIHNTDKLYKCRLCDHTVVDKELMLKHLHEHNEAVMYSCPKCPSLFNDDESLVLHMKGNHHFSFVHNSAQKPSETGNTHVLENVSMPQPTSIICSECGFVCKDTEVMQRHMWVHIKKDDKQSGQSNDVSKLTPVIKEENSSNLGVLKMNVDLGQKTLPKDVVYQCNSCCFTSRDNSAFIKHMLAHKTQEKKQIADLSGLSKHPNEDNQTTEAQTSTSAQSLARPVSYYPSSVPDAQSRLDSGVPFVYDKASARFRCVICGYHCEFQRTIKAHIWKHSGHQNIEYPTFDHVSSSSLDSPSTQALTNKESTKQADGAPPANPNSEAPSDLALQQNLPVLRTRSGDTVQLVPVNPLKTNYSPGNIIEIKNNSIIIPAKCGEASAASRFLESIAFSDGCSPDAQLKDRAVVQPSLTSLVTVEVSDRITIEVPVSLSSTKNKISVGQSLLKKHYTCPVNVAPKIDIPEQDDTRSSCDVDERCSEPSVVVEVIDTVPSETGLTGLKSQQGSPRIPDLDGSAGEVRLPKAFKTVDQQRSSCDLETTVSDSEKVGLDGASTKTVVDVKCADRTEDHHSYSTRLRCPTCDCLLLEDFKSHLLSCKKVAEEGDAMESKVAPESNKKFDVSKDHFEGDPQAEDTDSLESCYDMANSGSSTGQQKSGICSSLLAVIEQLRERSRSESEDDKQSMLAAKKGGKKKMRQDDDDLDFISIEDLQNIEKIYENGSDKFRCSLCHYSSHRICNIKLHMKTHRQKKPSECSLCEFSSSSPEALQEHMLKHCKVRTYPCKFCPQSFNHKSTLRAHLRAHKDQDPFLCAYCVFETTNPMEYREHMQVHSGCSSRLRCPGCDSVLSNKEELTAHLLMCKGSTRKNRHAADKNGTSEFDIEQDYDRMDLPLTMDAAAVNHACVVHGCSFSSSNLKELQDHLSVHCNPSLLVCNLCDFKALHSRSLKSHMKRHANDQRYVQQPLEQYKCNLCGYVCHHLPSLKSHMWRHASDQSYSYEFTNDVINAAIDHDTRVDADGDADDPELLDRVINSERKIMEGELTKFSKGDGHRPICWVTFRCCSCGFETINKAKLNVHMRSHSDIIQKALDIPRKPGNFQNNPASSPQPSAKVTSKRSNLSADSHAVPEKVMRREATVPM